jgi:RimJ/RimL family protein N-acetyltransferase
MTTQIQFRPYAREHAPILASYALDELYCAHEGWTYPSDPARMLAWAEHLADSPSDDLVRLMAFVDDEPVGYVDFQGNEATERELGYAIAPSSLWGQGLGTAAARAALDYGFACLRLDRIWAEAVQANAASVRVLEKSGMTFLRRGDDARFLDALSHYRQYEITRDEWLAQQGPAETLGA